MVFYSFTLTTKPKATTLFASSTINENDFEKNKTQQISFYQFVKNQHNLKRAKSIITYKNVLL